MLNHLGVINEKVMMVEDAEKREVLDRFRVPNARLVEFCKESSPGSRKRYGFGPLLSLSLIHI